jgi:hypothetical protein
MRVLPFQTIQRDELFERFGFGIRFFSPVGLDRDPEIPEPFVIGIAVLDD